ncbi:response regulator [Alkalicoccus daliensis]|uniref:Two-component system, CitB family, response regulator CitT n=1 Tax=Alkalicoccus daliensis TaxID=745820 RepID=A0A1H0EBB2_9BACI|nr:response regulator [Alkalicoccus daliensis]SDN79635.1 two-component system, CitB family, response regulator CitT [Alkalicoccus daliensis]
MYQVLIVEDDFHIAEINKAFVSEMPGFEPVHIAKSGEEAKSFIASSTLPDIILLDIYIPDVTGLELLWFFRKNYPSIQIIMITAAKETSTIQEALRAGIFDYIMKPVKKERVHSMLHRFHRERQALSQKESISQKELDELRSGEAAPAPSKVFKELPKGIDPITLEKVHQCLKEHLSEGVTAVSCADSTGTSRSTARRYLEFAVTAGEAKAELIYGEVGRPERRYFFQ